jgi:hypothetical protein
MQLIFFKLRAMIKLLPCDHEVMDSSPGKTCRNAAKCYVHKTQSGRTIPRTLRKLELRAPGWPFLRATINGSLHEK